MASTAWASRVQILLLAAGSVDVSGSTWEISDIWIQQYHWFPTDRFEMVSKQSFEEAQHDLRQKTNRPSTYI